MLARPGHFSWQPTSVALRSVRWLLRMLVAVPLTLIWFVAILLLPISKPLVFYPLVLATTACFGAALYFGATGQWPELFNAALTCGAGLAALTVYLAVAKAIDPEFDRSREPNPWFWQ